MVLRRLSIVLAAAASLAASALPSVADNFPSRPVTIIAPWPPGAGVDTMARILQTKFSEALGQPVVIENKPGSAGNIGAATALRAAPDGYTLMLTVNATVVMNPFLYKSFPFDPAKDMVGISRLTETYMALAVPASSPIKSIPDLVAEAKKQPGKLSYGSAGHGSGHHIAGETLNKVAGVEIQHVPFVGTAAAVTNVVGGHVSMTYATLPTIVSFVENGQLRIIGMAEDTRVKSMPNVPTIAETVPGVSTSTWYGLFAPAGTPKPVIDRLYKAVRFALDDPDTQKKLEKAGFTLVGSTPEELDARVKRDLAYWGKTIPGVGIEPR
ncbi:tripartite tricarboxylate transporter substrate binding protein [Pseudorhodoplanes sp.]|uniref:Bug family tripartite tricarboxylate transporter substrate binding protein n=1 Tax=Pseudorhodoplanes sp. TaxID=1934341 RepID=UPI002B825869|nr:tripartite tricarboxylate transporter substrate binding protein [Pseudorhodoplanes sp.]HWV51487.1 tripartite tricarboxylate transporter substrate binding protein [Pseudorhodoplanes sp.]